MLHFRCSACGALNRVGEERLAAGPRCGRCRTPVDPSARPQEVDDDQLQHLLSSSPVPVLVDFWAPWCGPCRMVAPRLEELARHHRGRLVVVKVNTDQHTRTAGSLQVRSIPTLGLWKDARLQKLQAGALSGPALEEFVGPFL